MVTRTKKIFVGGLSVNTTVEDVKHYFEQFGKVGLSLWVVLCLAWESTRVYRSGGSQITSVTVNGEEGSGPPAGEVRPNHSLGSRLISGPQTLDLFNRVSHYLSTLPPYFSPASHHSPEGGGASVASSIQRSPPLALLGVCTCPDHRQLHLPSPPLPS